MTRRERIEPLPDPPQPKLRRRLWRRWARAMGGTGVDDLYFIDRVVDP